LLYAFFGLILARAIPAILMGRRFVFETTSAYSVQFEIGCVVVLACAWFGAPRLSATGARSYTDPVALSVGSFVAGAFAACWASFFLFGGHLERNGLSDYIIKPLFWLALYGIPASFLIGALLSRSLNRRGK
jgi:hypothetical protein